MIVAVLVALAAGLIACIATVRLATARGRADALIAVHMVIMAVAVALLAFGAARSDAVMALAGAALILAGSATVWALAGLARMHGGRADA